MRQKQERRKHPVNISSSSFQEDNFDEQFDIESNKENQNQNISSSSTVVSDTSAEDVGQIFRTKSQHFITEESFRKENMVIEEPNTKQIQRKQNKRRIINTTKNTNLFQNVNSPPSPLPNSSNVEAVQKKSDPPAKKRRKEKKTQITEEIKEKLDSLNTKVEALDKKIDVINDTLQPLITFLQGMQKNKIIMNQNFIMPQLPIMNTESLNDFNNKLVTDKDFKEQIVREIQYKYFNV